MAACDRSEVAWDMRCGTWTVGGAGGIVRELSTWEMEYKIREAMQMVGGAQQNGYAPTL